MTPAGAPRGPHRRGGISEVTRALIAFLLCAAAVPSVPAQNTPEEPAAILVAGPARDRSLTFLPPNVIEYQRGIYELVAVAGGGPDTAAGPSAVTVYYTDQPVFRREAWSEASCNGRALTVIDAVAGPVYHYAWPDAERHVFFRFDGGPGDAGAEGAASETPGADAGAAPAAPGAAATPPGAPACGFILPFLERFSFFLETTPPSRAAPFPAVLPRE